MAALEEGTYEIRLVLRTAGRSDAVSTLRFDVDGPLPPGRVAVTYYPANTTKAVMAVTVDD